MVFAHVPADIRFCFRKMTSTPMPGEMSREKVVELITALRTSEYRKTVCGVRLLHLYDQQAQAWSKK